MDIFDRGKERAADQDARAAASARDLDHFKSTAQRVVRQKTEYVNDQICKLYHRLTDTGIAPTCTVWQPRTRKTTTGFFFKQTHTELSRDVTASGWIIWHETNTYLEKSVGYEPSIAFFESCGLVLRTDGTVSWFEYRAGYPPGPLPEEINEHREPLSVPGGIFAGDGKYTDKPYDLTTADSAYELSSLPHKGSLYVSVSNNTDLARAFDQALKEQGIAERPGSDEAYQIHRREQRAYCFAAAIEDGLVGFVARTLC